MDKGVVQRIGFILLLTLSALTFCFGQRQGGEVAAKRFGVLVMAHGGSSEWNEAVKKAVKPLASYFPIAIAFGMANPFTLQRAVDKLERHGVTHIAVVRLFVSPDSFRHATEYLFGLRPDPPPKRRRLKRLRFRAKVTLNDEGLMDSPLMGEILAERAKTLSKDPSREAVLILAHGAEDDKEDDRWKKAIDRLADKVRELGFAIVRVETLREDWPEKREGAAKRIRAFVRAQTEMGRRVLVLPFRVYGFGPYRRVLSGLSYIADERGLLPHPFVTQWLLEQAEKCFRNLRGVSGEQERHRG